MITRNEVKLRYGSALEKIPRLTGCGIEFLDDGDDCVEVLLRWQTSRGALGHIAMQWEEADFGIGSAINFRRFGRREENCEHPAPEELVRIVQIRHAALARALLTA